ncbi:MAG: GNAT family N-acetyltransferase [Fimbriimonas sp.]
MALFETERLLVRRLEFGDVDAMMAIYGDRETVRFVGDSEPLSPEACRHWVEVTDGNFARRGYGMVALVLRETGELVGCAGIVHPGQQPEAEVKYAFRRDQWGKGLASEAVRGLVDYARAVWGVGNIIATVDPENLVSQRVLAKSGFVYASDRFDEDGLPVQVWSQG